MGINEPTPDDTTLVVSPRHLGQERFERLFNRVEAQCRERGLLEERLKIVDATHVIANITVPNTTNLLLQARRAVVRSIEKETQTPQPDLHQRYQTAEAVHHEPTAEALAQATALSQEIFQEVKGRYGEVLTEKVALAKQWQGLGWARYWGKAEVSIQALMTFFVLNVKRIVKLLKARELDAKALAALS